MAGLSSAYATLGLDPDADAVAIEQAYRSLIKQHHPDRGSGDAARAAEIIRAYRELQAARGLKDPLEFHEEWPLGRHRRGSRLWLLVLLAPASIALWLSQSPARWPLPGQSATHPPRPLARAVADPMDAALEISSIDGAIARAKELSRTRDEMALSTVSADCHGRLRSDPSLTQFDRCAAFDDAVVQLQDRDPLRDQGPFSELAVTGRIRSGAAALSSDSVAVDARLDRIRARVEGLLAERPGG